MDDEVEVAPRFLDASKDAVDAVEVEDVGGFDDLRAERLGERQRAAAEGAVLIGEGELRALAGEDAGDAPGDRSLVGDAHDEAALAGHDRARFG